MSDEQDARGPVELRRVTDAQTLRALTHPTRIALLEVLSFDGPQTATEAAEKVGESPSSCSFHLRQLARYGFVEEAGGGTGRRRPWKMTEIGMSISTDFEDDPPAAIAATALSGMLHERSLARYDAWRANRASYPREWREAAIDSQYGFWLTAEELTALAERLQAELMPLARERLTDPTTRPEGALLVELLTLGFPIAPPPASAGPAPEGAAPEGTAPAGPAPEPDVP